MVLFIAKSLLLTSLLAGMMAGFHVDALVMPNNNPLELLCRSNHDESKYGTPITLPRSDALRHLLSSAALMFPASALAMYENAPIRSADMSTSGPTVLPSGVSYEDLRPGTGDIITEGKRVNIQWVLKVRKHTS